MTIFSCGLFNEKNDELKQLIRQNLKSSKDGYELISNFFNVSSQDLLSYSAIFKKTKYLVVFTYYNVYSDLEIQDGELQDVFFLSKKYQKQILETGQATEGKTPSQLILSSVLKAFSTFDSNQAFYLSRILQTNHTFREAFCNYMMDKNVPDSLSKLPNSNDHCSLIFLHLLPSVSSLNYSWCGMLCGLTHRRVVMVEGMNWLSTLGGAYSALADQDQSFVKLARKTSTEQFLVALKMGDVNLAMRCILFLTLTKIQQGKYKQASLLIKYVHKQCKRGKEKEKRSGLKDDVWESDGRRIDGNLMGGDGLILRSEEERRRRMKKKAEKFKEEERIMAKMDQLSVDGRGVTESVVLLRMCRGIWSKLSYERSLRKQPSTPCSLVPLAHTQPLPTSAPSLNK